MKNGFDTDVVQDELHYPESLKPSKELLAKVQRQQTAEYGYDSSSNLYFFVTYEMFRSHNNCTMPLTEIGRHMYFIEVRDDCFDEEAQLKYIKAIAEEQNYYIYNEIKKKLFYVIKDQMEVVQIKDQSLFDKTLNDLCSPYKYSTKFLKFDEITLLITNNGGHQPLQAELQQHSDHDEAKDTGIIDKKLSFQERLQNSLFNPKSHSKKSDNFQKLMQDSRKIEEAESVKHGFLVHDEEADIYYTKSHNPMLAKLGIYAAEDRGNIDSPVEEASLVNNKM